MFDVNSPGEALHASASLRIMANTRFCLTLYTQSWHHGICRVLDGRVSHRAFKAGRRACVTRVELSKQASR